MHFDELNIGDMYKIHNDSPNHSKFVYMKINDNVYFSFEERRPYPNPDRDFDYDYVSSHKIISGKNVYGRSSTILSDGNNVVLAITGIRGNVSCVYLDGDYTHRGYYIDSAKYLDLVFKDSTEVKSLNEYKISID